MKLALVLLALVLSLLVGIAALRPAADSRRNAENVAHREEPGTADDVHRRLAAARDGVVITAARPPSATTLGMPEDATSDPFSSNPRRSATESYVLNIVRADVPDAQKVEDLLRIAPELPGDAQRLAVEEAVELIPDTTYLHYRERLFQLAYSEELRAAIIDDALTRGEEVRLPTLVEMMRLSISESERTEIREVLEAYLDADYGPDPKHWEAPVRRWVATAARG